MRWIEILRVCYVLQLLIGGVHLHVEIAVVINYFNIVEMDVEIIINGGSCSSAC